MIEQGLISLLLNEPSINSLVSTRITPVLLPTAQPMPAITITVIVGTSTPTLTSSGLQKWRIQFDCWGDTYLDATTVRDALIPFLANKQFTFDNGVTATFILIGPNGIPYSGGDELFRASFDMYALFNLPQ
jgi:hypothetical protein